MINQMVTRHQAQLTLIGIAEHENLKATIAARMKRILT
ncbi:hypothetical protein DESC_780213 [Desulfosarcina cetonica]|nr:hypothetical protein DESC_780213 [Desulfosarcina cetonica]